MINVAKKSTIIFFFYEKVGPKKVKKGIFAYIVHPTQKIWAGQILKFCRSFFFQCSKHLKMKVFTQGHFYPWPTALHGPRFFRLLDILQFLQFSPIYPFYSKNNPMVLNKIDSCFDLDLYLGRSLNLKTVVEYKILQVITHFFIVQLW